MANQRRGAAARLLRSRRAGFALSGRNISAPPTVVDCSPMSVDDQSTTSGSLDVVGTVVNAFAYGSGPYQGGGSSVDVKAFFANRPGDGKRQDGAARPSAQANNFGVRMYQLGTGQ